MHPITYFLTVAFAAPVFGNASCVLPADFKPPADVFVTAERHKNLSYEVERIIPIPVSRFQTWINSVSLDSLLRGTKDIPRVAGTVEFGGISFPSIGARRYVCLADGSSAVEQVVAYQENSYFAYKVGAYTLPQAQGIEYGYGEFFMEPEGDATRLKWRYSFSLKKDRFPGNWGALGRLLFRKTFLDTKYAAFMNGAVDTIKSEAESANRESYQRGRR